MKKRLGVMLSLVLIAGVFTGCGSGDYTNKSEFGFKACDYVTLGDYKGLKAYDVEVSADADELEEEINNSLYEYAEYKDITDRGAEYSDYVNFDYSATIDGNAISDCAYKDYEVQIGSGEFNEDIEESIVGHKPGDVYTLKTVITEDLGESHVGELAVFTVTVNSIQVEKIPELTESFVKENTDYKTVEEYREGVKTNLIESKKAEYENTIRENLLDEVVKNSKYKSDRPEELKKVCKEATESDVAYQAEMFGMTVEELKEEFYEEGEYEESIDEEVDLRLAVYAIAEKEKLFYSKNGLKKYEEEQYKADEYESVEEYISDTGEDVIKYESTYNNVVDFLFDNATKEKISEEKYVEMNPDIYDEEIEDDEDDSSLDAIDSAGASEDDDDVEGDEVDSEDDEVNEAVTEVETSDSDNSNTLEEDAE